MSRGNAQVAGEGEREPAAERRAVHCGKDDLRRRPDVDHQVGEVALAGLAGREVRVRPRGGDRAPVLQVEPGAERAPRAGEHDHLAAVVGGDAVEGVVQLPDKAEVDGVETVRAVETDGGDVLGDGLDLDGRHVYRVAKNSARASHT